MEIFHGCYTLKQLNPDRTVFHVSEVLSFCHAMGLYSVETNNLEQAKIYLHMVERIEPDHCIAKDLKDAIKKKMFFSGLDEFIANIKNK